MKYLKLFENTKKDIEEGRDRYYKSRDEYWDGYLYKLNKEINKPKENHDEYYKLIDNSDQDEYSMILRNLFKTCLELKDPEIENIKKMFPKVYSLKMIGSRSALTNERCLEANREKTILRIWKLEDEYFLVALGDMSAMIYFKCDQWEGLEYFLNKTLIKDEIPKTTKRI